MTVLQDITRVAPASEPLIHIWKTGHIGFNAPAARLLGLDDSSKVAFRVKPAQEGERPQVYVGRRKDTAYALTRRARTYRIHATDLARSLADALQGYGTYRIEEDDKVTDFGGNVYNGIFFKKFE